MTRTMKGAVAAWLAAGAVGCHSTCATGDCNGGASGRADHSGPGDGLHHKYIDPCWPERYNYVARQEVLAPFAVQVNNAHILDQTLLNLHFVPGSDEISGAGYEKLNYLVRRRPGVDPRLYLQTARDISYDAAKADDYVAGRRDLDLKRAEAIKKYAAVQTAGRPVPFEVVVIDPTEPTIRTDIIIGATRGLPTQFGSSAGTGPGVVNGGGISPISVNVPTSGGAPVAGTTAATGAAGGTSGGAPTGR